MTSARQIVGSIAVYPKAIYCATSTLIEGHFEEIDHKKIALPSATQSPLSSRQVLERAASYFNDKNLQLAGLGVSMYGVIDRGNSRFISAQPNWDESIDVKAELTQRTNLVEQAQIYCLSDSTAAAIGEYLWGAAIDIHHLKSVERNFAYFKVIDGIGSGILVDGRIREAEMGHMPLRRARDDRYPGRCPKHTDCVEGLASYVALLDRAYMDGFPDIAALDAQETHGIWHVEAHYIAELAIAALLTFDARRIVFEGDVFRREDGTKRDHFLKLISKAIQQLLNGYPEFSDFIADFSKNLVLSHLKGEYASLLGALEVARQKALQPLKEVELKFNIDPKTSVQFRKSIRRFAHDGAPPVRSYEFAPLEPQRKKVFGLSIAETVEWTTAIAEDGKIATDIQEGILCDIPPGLMPFNPHERVYLEEELRKGLRALHTQSPEVFQNVKGVGVSTIGLVSREDLSLLSIARKNWVARSGGPPIVDFEKLFLLGEEQLFPGLPRSAIAIQNDAPARCLTEYLYGPKKDRPKSLLYLMVGEGVNGALLYEGDLLDMLRHPALGHCMPSLHPYDLNFSPAHSGCPRHWRCFEGIASTSRVRLQWGKELWELPENHMAWDILAFYLSQLAMTGVLMGDVESVIFGGAAFHGPKGLKLLEKVQNEFIVMNANYLPYYGSLEAVEKLIRRAEFGPPIKTLSALTIACAAAFKEASPVGSLTAKEQAHVIDFPRRTK